MSDVVSWIVVIGTLGSLVAFALLLLLNRKSGKPGETTGHSYDGIEEYDNPLPAWWFWAFMLSIVFGALYLVYYPGLGNFEGIGKWTQLGELSEDQKISEEKYAPVFSQYRSQSIKQLSQNEEALKIGRRLFSNNCVMCHGSSATGSSGFPNLTDSEWLWGQEPADIQYSIQNGRNAAMPPWEAVLQDKGVSEVAAYVVSLAGREGDATLIADGKQHYVSYCQACHGPGGEGNKLFGAPDLTNEIWLYGNSLARIENVVAKGRNGVMPAFGQKLGEDKVRILAAYVISLSAKGDASTK